MPLSLREACELSHTLGNPSGCDSKCDSERMLSKLSSKAKNLCRKAGQYLDAIALLK